MNYFSSKNHASWCCFLFKCKLTQKNPFILRFEQKASDFLKGKRKLKQEGRAGRERESRKGERKRCSRAASNPTPRETKGKKGGRRGKRKGERKGGKKGKPRPRLLDEAMVYRRLLMPAIDYSQILITLKNRLPSK